MYDVRRLNSLCAFIEATKACLQCHSQYEDCYKLVFNMIDPNMLEIHISDHNLLADTLIVLSRHVRSMNETLDSILVGYG